MVKGGGTNPQNAKESKKSRLVSRLFVASMGESSEESGVSDNILCTKPSKPTLDALSSLSFCLWGSVLFLPLLNSNQTTPLKLNPIINQTKTPLFPEHQ